MSARKMPCNTGPDLGQPGATSAELRTPWDFRQFTPDEQSMSFSSLGSFLSQGLLKSIDLLFIKTNKWKEPLQWLVLSSESAFNVSSCFKMTFLSLSSNYFQNLQNVKCLYEEAAAEWMARVHVTHRLWCHWHRQLWRRADNQGEDRVLCQTHQPMNALHVCSTLFQCAAFTQTEDAMHLEAPLLHGS